jgi:release factor glutamine methyltransferase
MSSADERLLDEAEVAAAAAHVEEAQRTGRCTFFGIELLVDAGALVPRAETELLARLALEHLLVVPPAADGTLTVIDMCCGSGNLACALAVHEPRARVLAADLTDGCVSLARRNVAYLGLGDRVQVFQGDLFSAFAALPGGTSSLDGKVALVICNPPYISTARLGKDRASLLCHEPVEAFDGGPYGLSVHQRVIKDALSLLRPDGLLMFEMGIGQDRQLKLLFDRAKSYPQLVFIPDARGRPRVAIATRTPLPASSPP